jgi:holliday junction DNA helicase RuvA
MIRLLRGTIAGKLRNQVILDVHGVGYGVFVSPNFLTSALESQELTLHISESIREDGYDLYGFSSVGERDVFELLRKVSGVGPKVALGISAFYPPSDLMSILHQGDSAKLTVVPGVGPKLATKIVVELRDKADTTPHTDDPGLTDVIDALQSLGYHRSEIAKVLPKLPAALSTTSEKVTWILRYMSD